MTTEWMAQLIVQDSIEQPGDIHSRALVSARLRRSWDMGVGKGEACGWREKNSARLLHNRASADELSAPGMCCAVTVRSNAAQKSAQYLH